jgi:hypothetical protein
MRKNCGKLLIKKNSAITSKCFDIAVDEIIVKWAIDEEKHSKKDLIIDMRMPALLKGIRNIFGEHDTHPEIYEIKEAVDSLYLEKLCTLLTKDIEDIIWIHECGKLKRASRTIETLTSELVRRAIMGDSSQSESKTNSKSTISKRKSKKVNKKKKPLRRAK